MGEQPQSGDGLVMPEAFPCKSKDINAENVRSASGKLKSMGQVVDSRMDAIVGLWNGLPAVYVAPEAEQAYGLMAPAATASETIKTKFEKASSALDDFAGAIEPVKSELETLEQEAASFRSATLSEYGDKWRDHQEVVDRNNALLGRYAKVVETLTTAAAACANSINGLLDGVELPAVEGISADALMQSGEMMPWGAPVEKNRNCAESVGHGVQNFAQNTWEGAQALFGRGADGSWSWENASNAWVGVGDFALSVWVAKNPVVAAGVTLLGGKDGAQWVADRYKVVAKAAAGMVGFDLDAHLEGRDGFHKWKKDGVVASVTESVLNIASARIPGAGPVKGVIGAKLGAAAPTTLNLATRAADYALPGGGWLIRGGVKVVDLGLEQIQKLRSKTSVDLTDTAAPTKPGPLTPSGHTPSGHGGNPPHTTTSSSSGSGGGGGVLKSSGPGPDFQPPRNPGGPRLNPLHGLNLDANNPTTNTGSGTSTNTSAGSGTGTGTGSGSAVGTGSSHASTTGTGTSTGSGTGTGTGSGAGSTGSSGASHGGTNSGSPQPHINTGSSTSTGSGSGHANTSSSTGTGSAVGSGSGHASTGHGAGAGSGASHAGTSSGSSAGSSGANSGASQQPHANTGSGPRPDPLIEKPRPHHTPENNPTTTNGNGDTESPTSGKNPTHPHPKDLSTPTTRNNNGDTPHTHHDQETTAPSSRGNPHVHGSDSTPTNTHNPPTNPEHHPTDPDHPTNPEHPSQAGDGSSSTGKSTGSDASKLPDPPTVETWDGKEIPNTLRPGQAKERFGVDYTDANVKQAYDNAFDPTKGEHVDPRTGEPLVETTRDGRGRGWEMRYDPATKQWSAWNRGDGYGRAGKPIAFPDYDPEVGKTYSSGDGLAPGDPHPHTPPETHNRATGTPGVEHVNRGNTSGKENPKIENWLKYQEQITGWKRNNKGEIPEYTLYDSKGKPVRIDGRTWRGHPPQEVYLDAKRGYQRVYYDPTHSEGMRKQLIAEANRQLGVLPPGAKLEWHISSREGADAISRILEDARIYNVDVFYTPER